MRLKRNFYLIISITIINLILISGCSRKKTDPDKAKIAVSILPLAEFVEKIGGEFVSITVMVPPGASPHAFEPKPSQMVELSKADMYVKVGTPIEFELAWMEKITGINKNMMVVNASKGISLESTELKHDHDESDDHHNHHVGGLDPHTWLSPKNAIIMVENIYEGLASLFPDKQKTFEKNKIDYVNELINLDKEIKEKLRNKESRKFMVYHPAWGYFAREYHLEQISIENEGKAPTAAGIQHLIEQAKENSIRIIFASPQFDTNNAELIAREIGGKVILVSTLEKNYIQNVERLAQSLYEALE